MSGTVLLIGGSGFIGSHLADAFLGAGWGVRVLDARPERFRAMREEVRYVEGDCADPVCLQRAVGGCGCVVHLAHRGTPVTSVSHPEQEVIKSVLPFVSLLTFLRECPVPRFLYLSSGGAVYGNTPRRPIDEETALHPISAYGVAKVTMENYLHMFHALTGQPYIILRPSNVYGPRQEFHGPQGLVAVALRRLLDGAPVEIWGDGGAVKDFLYVSDLAEAIVRLAAAERSMGLFNVGSGIGTRVADAVRRCAATVGVAARIEYRPAEPFDVQHCVLDSARLRAATGWAPAVPLADGIRRTCEWMLQASGTGAR
jgi:UDP-glucose 4-epimerase